MITKTVTIKKRSDQDILHGQHVLAELRAAGVLWPQGVAGGSLRVKGDVWTCEWEEIVEELF